MPLIVGEQALLHYFDKTTGRKSRKPPQFAKKSQRVVALLETTAPICIERFSDYPQLGRFTLRDEGTGAFAVSLLLLLTLHFRKNGGHWKGSLPSDPIKESSLTTLIHLGDKTNRGSHG